MEKRPVLFSFLGVLLIVGIIISDSWLSKKDIEKDGLYTIVEINNFSFNSDGSRFADYSYFVNNNEYKSSFPINTMSDIKVSKGSRFFLIFSQKDPSKAYLIDDIKVPDSIKFTPGQYWKKKPWIKNKNPSYK